MSKLAFWVDNADDLAIIDIDWTVFAKIQVVVFYNCQSNRNNIDGVAFLHSLNSWNYHGPIICLDFESEQYLNSNPSKMTRYSFGYDNTKLKKIAKIDYETIQQIIN